MGPLIIKALPPQIQRVLIRFPQSFNLATDVTMHSLMGAVVLRVAGSAPFQINPQRHPPGREPTQPQEPVDTGKRASIVAADRLRQADSLKKPLKTLSHGLSPGVLDRAQLQHVAAVLIAYAQRFAPPAPASPPPFKVHRPYFVRSVPFSPVAQTTRLPRAAMSPLLREAAAFQHSLKGAFACHLPMPSQIQFTDLARPPRRVCQLQAHYLA